MKTDTEFKEMCIRAYESGMAEAIRIQSTKRCESCKYHNDINKSYKQCSQLEIATSKEFGCELYEKSKD
ncbi:MAG: hypothetical protein COB42_08215 [Sulfurimonas sp.]|nr:MAG: hypothetical protein COB42_08215 [Sulfurimonas sp.]